MVMDIYCTHNENQYTICLESKSYMIDYLSKNVYKHMVKNDVSQLFWTGKYKSIKVKLV